MTTVSVADLAARLANSDNAARLRVVDVRWYLNRPGAGHEAYLAGHISSAIFLDLDDDLSAPGGVGAPGRHPLPSPSAFTDRMLDAGIGTDDFVVAYDDAGGTVAARLWWMLDNLAHRGGCAVLDGGLQAWQRAGQPLASGAEHVARAASLELAAEWRNVVERQELAAGLGSVALLDARAGERYRGEFEPIDPAAGHIPTATSLPATGNLDADGLFMGPDELRARFDGAVGDGPAVVYCGSGTTACHSVLAARLAGLADPTLYVGSFSDWSRSGMPIATGAEPGSAP